MPNHSQTAQIGQVIEKIAGAVLSFIITKCQEEGTQTEGAVLFSVSAISPSNGWQDAKVWSPNGQETNGKRPTLELRTPSPSEVSCDFIIERDKKHCFVEVKGTRDTKVELTASQLESVKSIGSSYHILVIRYSDIPNGIAHDEVKVEWDSDRLLKGRILKDKSEFAKWGIISIGQNNEISFAEKLQYLQCGATGPRAQEVIALKIWHGVEAPQSTQTNIGASSQTT